MRVLVSGSGGLVGSALLKALAESWHSVIRLTRGKPTGKSLYAVWDPQELTIDLSKAGAIEGVVHLAGESIIGRWSLQKKALIRHSRVKATALLCDALARLPDPPKVLVSASAIGFYGNRGELLLDEESDAGAGFLPEVCKEWEAATRPASEAGIRVVHLRLGVVLARDGGALAKMLPPFQLGLGGPLGSGRQYFSWVALDDVVGAIQHALTIERVTGPVNAVSPQPLTNKDFTAILAKVLKRPAIFPVPSPVLRLAMGEMADALLLASARVLPKRLLETGYAFRYPDAEGALRHILKQQRAPEPKR